ncbi:MAG: putative nucleic acid-binding Zn-ribbon protein [Planctomycetota bacterium]|jgi:predicted  nucleic acid-binding Zn-ribbon protein
MTGTSPKPTIGQAEPIKRGLLDVLDLPFDQYQRYRLVTDLIQAIPGGGRARILDVGGRTELLRSFLPQHQIDLVDLETADVPGLVLGSGSRLPFQSSSFDIVCAFDTLEHVPPEQRADFVDECARVSRSHVILAGPYQSAAVDEAEESLRDFLRDKLALEHRYLDEHRTHGLPALNATEERLRAQGARVTSIGHAYLGRWLPLMCAEIYMDHDPLLRPLARRFFRFYNQVMYATDAQEPVYRHAVVAALDGAPMPVPDALFAPPVDEASVAAVTDFGRFLLEFDVQRDVLQPELVRLRGVIADLTEDLDGHKQRLFDTRSDLSEHEASLAEAKQIHSAALQEHASEKAALEADLLEHERSLEEALRIRAEDHRQADLARTALRADLAEHAASIADMERDKAALQEDAAQSRRQAAALEASLRGELEQHRAVQTELQGTLAETQAGAQSIQDELLRARADIDDLLEKLAEREASIADMLAQLRDRWGNLKRAIGPKPMDF